MAREQYYKPTGKPLHLFEKNNTLLTRAVLDNRADTVWLVFDTGASATLLLDSSLVNIKNKKKAYFGKAQLPNGNQLRPVKFLLDYSTEMYEARELVSLFQQPVSDPCAVALHKGIIGNDFLAGRAGKMRLLDFQNMEVEVLTDEERILALLGEGYQEVKSEFFRVTKDHIKIFLTVNGVEEAFHFDTGNSAAPLILCPQSKINPGSVSATGYVGVGMRALDNQINMNDTSMYFDQIKVGIGNTETYDMILVKSTSYQSKYNNVGYSFLKNYNWILDYRNKKVYFKPNERRSFRVLPEYSYRAIATPDHQLLIGRKKITETRYRLGSQIRSVNGETVTPDNICALRTRLNREKHWDDFLLEVR